MKHHIAALAVLSALTLAACSPTIANRGNLISDNIFKQVEADKSSRDDVTRIWGSPTTVSSFDNDTWYYIGETTEQTGIFLPKVTKRRLVRVRFDGDKVASIEDLDPSKAENIAIVSRTTPNAGKDFTAVQQLIGNIGRYNGSGDSKKPDPYN